MSRTITKYMCIFFAVFTAAALFMMEQYGYAVLIIIVWWVIYQLIKDVD
jgi:hypothetical protein